MKLAKLIKLRVSNSKFNSNSVDHDLILKLLDSAVYAPNHKMREPWRFIILEEKGKDRFVHLYLESLNAEIREKIEPLIYKVFSSPTVVAFIMPPNANLRDEIEDMEAVAIVIQNFLLLATEAGLATSWKTPLYSETDLFKDQLGLSPRELVIGLVMVGYSDIILQPKLRKSASSVTTFYQ
ncbi:MAG: nitroreductase [Bacillota bacterium]